MITLLKMELRLVRQVRQGNREGIVAAARVRELRLLELILRLESRAAHVTQANEPGSPLTYWGAVLTATLSGGAKVRRHIFFQAKDRRQAENFLACVVGTLYPERTAHHVVALVSEWEDPHFVFGRRVVAARGRVDDPEPPVVVERDHHDPAQWLEDQGIAEPLLAVEEDRVSLF